MGPAGPRPQATSQCIGGFGAARGIDFRILHHAGLHWRDCFVLLPTAAWRIQLDHGLLDYLSRSETQEFARARTGKLEIIKFPIGARAFVEKVQELATPEENAWD